MINKNYLNMLGLANAARALVNGETLIKSISANKVELVLIANDARDPYGRENIFAEACLIL